VAHRHHQPDCGGNPSRDPDRLAKVAGRVGCRGDDRSLSALTKNQPCSYDDGLLLVTCSVAPAGLCASSLPTPPFFAIGGVVLYGAGEGVIDQAAGTGDKGLASLGGQSCPVAPKPRVSRSGRTLTGASGPTALIVTGNRAWARRLLKCSPAARPAIRLQGGG
jgi:hypothetical protein